MSITEHRTTDTAAASVDRVGWAVPGLGLEDPARRSAGEDPATTSGTAGVGFRDELNPPSAGGPGGGGHPIVLAVLSCLEAVESVRGVGANSLRPAEIKLMLVAVVQLVAALGALKLRLLVAGELQRVQDLTGATSVPAFLAHLTQTGRAEASAEVRLAKDLDGRYALLGQALERGLLSSEQVKVCVNALRKLPRDVPESRVAECQQFLVEAARTMNPRQLKVIGRKLWEVIDPDGAETREGKDLEDEEELARAKAHFRSWRNGDGTTGFRGKLPDAQADMLIKAIEAFTAPRRRKSADPGSSDDLGDDLGRDDVCDELSAEERETGRAVPHPVKLGHGLMELLERLPRDLLPSSGGVTATVVVTMRLEQLLEGIGTTALDTGTPVSAVQARRWACEAGIIPVVLGGDSQPLDVGREQRLHTRYQRAAMALRDGGCVAEGCDRPPAWTEAHHPLPWSAGGDTSAANGVLLCAYHHHLVHNPSWQTTWSNGRVRLRRVFR